MYLAGLTKEERELFLDLTLYAAEADDKVEQIEKRVVKSFCNEMNIEYRDKAEHSLDNAISELSNSSEECKRSIVVELGSLFFSDSEYSNEEKDFMKKIMTKFEIEEEEFQPIITAMQDIVKLYKTIGAFVYSI